MKRLDIIIIVLMVTIALASLGFYKWNSSRNYDEKYVEISVKGEHFKTILLTDKTNRETFTINTDLGTNIVVIENGEVAIIQADCQDDLCVKDGFIKNPGEMVVCLPNKVVVEIKGQSTSQVDELSY